MNQAYHKTYNKAYYQKNKEAIRTRTNAYYRAHKEQYVILNVRAARKRHYGLTEAQFQILMLIQCGKCAICTRIMTNPQVDHIHGTRIVRGLVCGSCNRGIGLLQDDPNILLAASQYLEET
jgi:5-methylcytosine-specific restriction endonuclease McrA